MRGTLIIVIIFLASHLTGQNWQLFNFEVTHYMSLEIGGKQQIETFSIDTLLFGKFDMIFLNTVPCWHWDSETIHDFYNTISHLMNPDKPAFYQLNGESVLIHYYIPGQHDWFVFEFQPLAEPGDSWVTNGVTIECTSKYLDSVLGVTDSIKVFTCQTIPYDNIQFILAKNHGFIELPAIPMFYYTSDSSYLNRKYSLIGITNRSDSTSRGYVPPGYREYFNLNVGDILIWKDTSQVWIPVSYTKKEYYIDTIVETLFTEDTVRYKTSRGYFNEHGTFKYRRDHEILHTKDFEGTVFESQTHWFVQIDDGAPYPYYSLNSIELEPDPVDTLITIQFSNSLGGLDSYDCSSYPVYDNTDRFTITNRKGLINSFHGGLGGNRWITLIGSIIDGIPEGEVEVPTHASVPEVNHMQVYPNPATGRLNIETKIDLSGVASVFNLNGQLSHEQYYNGAAIDISNLESGMYIVHLITTDGEHYLARFIRQ